MESGVKGALTRWLLSRMHAWDSASCGTPLVAYGRGGATDIVQPDITGVLFPRQEASSLIAAVNRFETLAIAPEACRANAERFSRTVFRDRMRSLVSEACAARGIATP
jgi:glycosyltransferase involved in cell wall biosynthesis